jgi:hypothetical protein
MRCREFHPIGVAGAETQDHAKALTWREHLCPERIAWIRQASDAVLIEANPKAAVFDSAGLGFSA